MVAIVLLPITAEQSRTARFQLGLTQADVINSSGLPAHKLKQFETGRFIPDQPFLQALRDYYVAQGAQLPDNQAEQPGSTDEKGKRNRSVAREEPRMCFWIDQNLPGDQVDRLLTQMDENETFIRDLMVEAADEGLFAKWSDATHDKLRMVLAAMAMNHLLFRMLQGQNMLAGADVPADAKTIAGIVAEVFEVLPGFADIISNAQKAASPATATPADTFGEDEEEAA